MGIQGFRLSAIYSLIILLTEKGTEQHSNYEEYYLLGYDAV
jgi:hypothetical protein